MKKGQTYTDNLHKTNNQNKFQNLNFRISLHIKSFAQILPKHTLKGIFFNFQKWPSGQTILFLANSFKQFQKGQIWLICPFKRASGTLIGMVLNNYGKPFHSISFFPRFFIKLDNDHMHNQTSHLKCHFNKLLSQQILLGKIFNII